jgi:L-2-hydroxyglutarate oxidase LhgO
MEKTDILIIGAGVIGLAIARELSFKEKNIIIVEKNKSFGQETSSRNSEVIHGGMYYPAGTLKAELCINGRRLLYKLCADNKIPHKKTGKLIVATNKDELATLEQIAEQGKMNEVEGLEFITEAKIKKLEPEVSAIAALYSKETGIVDSHQLMLCLLKAAEKNGASIVYDAEVVAIEKSNNGYKITVKNGEENVEIQALVVINCAGLDSDAIAGMIGIDIDKEGYTLHYCKGQYFRITSNKSKLINRLVYPVPYTKSGGLGIHITPDLSGNIRLGPDDTYLNNRVKDYFVDEDKRHDFFQSVVKFAPFIEETDLIPDTSGIRPKLQPEGGKFRDFVIRDEADKGFPGFINLIGIESPGLTAAPAVAKKVKDMILSC